MVKVGLGVLICYDVDNPTLESIGPLLFINSQNKTLASDCYCLDRTDMLLLYIHCEPIGSSH